MRRGRRGAGRREEAVETKIFKFISEMFFLKVSTHQRWSQFAVASWVGERRRRRRGRRRRAQGRTSL